jgi:hypothetical protein
MKIPCKELSFVSYLQLSWIISFLKSVGHYLEYGKSYG